MAPPYITLLELILNGEPVDANTTNRPIQQLGSRTDHLKAIIDGIGAATGTFDINVAMDPLVEEGMPVYWNVDKQLYDRAQALFDANNTGIFGNIADSSFVLGICASKTSTAVGSVVFSGNADGTDFTSAIDGDIIPGPYYLSAKEPGKLVKTRPAVGIHVMFAKQALGGGKADAFVQPTPREVLEDHIHYQILLEFGNIVGDPGWTSSFDISLAPAGAIYRYTIEDDEEANSLFPFLPVESTYYDVNGIGGNEKVIIDKNGIWWIDTVNLPSVFSRHTIYYAKMVAKTNETMVTSLKPATEDSPISIKDCNGNLATTGDLLIDLDLILDEAGDDKTPGFLAFKELTTSKQFKRGPVVESIISDSPEISLSIVGSEGLINEDGSTAGKILIAFNNPTNSERNGVPSVTSLFNALQEDIDGLIPYIGLPQGRNSAVSYQFTLPTAGLSGTFKFFFTTWVYARVSGVLPVLSCDFSVLLAASNTVLTNISDGSSGTANLNIPIPNVNANDYVLATLLPGAGIEVKPGDQVHVKVNRVAGTSYAGTVGLLNVAYLLEK